VTITTSVITNNLRFPGQYWDAETGLHYNYYRDYNPAIGRYVEVDPIGIQQGQNHIFVYTKNQPTKYTDIYGLFCGSGSTEPYTPNSFGNINFSNACAGHDNCYDKCGSSKMSCDAKFLFDMMKECNKFIINPIVFIECQTLARIYYLAVSVAPTAWNSWKESQARCKCKVK
jgi:RHS repeat-associated protein